MESRIQRLVEEILELYAHNENLADSVFFVNRDRDVTLEESLSIRRELKSRFPARYA